MLTKVVLKIGISLCADQPLGADTQSLLKDSPGQNVYGWGGY